MLAGPADNALMAPASPRLVLEIGLQSENCREISEILTTYHNISVLGDLSDTMTVFQMQKEGM